MARVFITGGAGFIGRWVVARCLADGHEVTAYDNLCVGRKSNLDEFGDRVALVEADILDEERLSTALAKARPDIVFHLAAHHFIPYCNAHPAETLRVNVEGTEIVCRQAAAAGVKRLVAASTGACYPGTDGLLTEATPAVPVDIYGLSKHIMESVLDYYHRSSGLTVRIGRLFNTYGPYETNDHLIPHIMDSLKTGPSIELGNIYTKRDYIFVKDTAASLYGLSQVDKGDLLIANVGTGIEYSAEEIVQMLGQILGSEITISVDEARLRPVDKPHQMADISRLVSATGVKPGYSLEDGLKELVDFEGIAF
ncbi:MAG: NAD-dependent epimerase/dehydratase family protein [Bacteroidetes bacterium]|nr:NAD-dependent epimerase/dehydratase family protein [Bacteroidota bacterium]